MKIPIPIGCGDLAQFAEGDVIHVDNHCFLRRSYDVNSEQEVVA
jgi:hypothetical protein